MKVLSFFLKLAFVSFKGVDVICICLILHLHYITQYRGTNGNNLLFFIDILI